MADIGHLRHLRWVQDDDPASAINQPPSGSTLKAQDIAKSRWVSYNRMRGQYASAMEHATPEQFFVDKTQCGAANQPVCQQAISAVKALQIAAAEGQKIYTITQANFSSALPKISLSSAAREEIRNAVAAGKEVTIHERPIHAFGWSGSGYTVIDPETGMGAYMIEGGANGAFIEGIQFAALLAIDILLWFLTWPVPAATALPAYFSIMLAGALAEAEERYKGDPEALDCFHGGIFWGFAGLMMAAGTAFLGAGAGLAIGFVSWLAEAWVPGNNARQCGALPWQ